MIANDKSPPLWNMESLIRIDDGVGDFSRGRDRTLSNVDDAVDRGLFSGSFTAWPKQGDGAAEITFGKDVFGNAPLVSGGGALFILFHEVVEFRISWWGPDRNCGLTETRELDFAWSRSKRSARNALRFAPRFARCSRMPASSCESYQRPRIVSARHRANPA